MIDLVHRNFIISASCFTTINSYEEIFKGVFAEVEQVIAIHEAVSEVAVLGVPLQEEGEALVAFVVLQDGGRLDLTRLRAFCEPHLSRYKWPTRLFILKALPRTAVDKVDKKRLRGRLTQ